MDHGGGSHGSQGDRRGELVVTDRVSKGTEKINCQRRGVITLLKADCWVGGVGWGGRGL